jgi:hypothetical protein
MDWYHEGKGTGGSVGRVPDGGQRALLGAGMSPNSSMRALQCIKTAGELGGFKENSTGMDD